jgi:hypothetical protein
MAQTIRIMSKLEIGIEQIRMYPKNFTCNNNDRVSTGNRFFLKLLKNQYKNKHKNLKCGAIGLLEPYVVYNVNHNVHKNEIKTPISNWFDQL